MLYENTDDYLILKSLPCRSSACYLYLGHIRTITDRIKLSKVIESVGCPLHHVVALGFNGRCSQYASDSSHYASLCSNISGIAKDNKLRPYILLKQQL